MSTNHKSAQGSRPVRRTKHGFLYKRRVYNKVTWENPRPYGGRSDIWLPVNEYGHLVLGFSKHIPPRVPLKCDAGGTVYKWVLISVPVQAGRWAFAVVDTRRVWAAKKPDESDKYSDISTKTCTTKPGTSQPILKTFIREYTYRASERDSKQSSRTAALTELKKELLEEVVGVVIVSSHKDKINETNEHITESYSTETHIWSESITQTKILNERWDGRFFYVKAEITVDLASFTQL